MSDSPKKLSAAKQLGLVLTAWSFLLVLGCLFVANLIYTPPELSESERRYLNTAPPLFVSGTEDWRGKTVLNPEFSDKFELYAMDSFVFREGFRGLKSSTLFHLFRQMDNHGIFLMDGHAGKIETLDEESLRRAGNKIAALIAQLPQGADVYYAVIPDKGYYLSRQTGGLLPGMDYKEVARLLGEALGTEGYIDLLPALSAEDYYRSDLHWSQDKLEEVRKTLGSSMGFGDRLEGEFTSHRLEPFYGAYCGQVAMPLSADSMVYLTSAAIDASRVALMNPSSMQLEESAMYCTDRFTGMDPYDVFLSGAQPIVIIENPTAATQKELFLFRDSFGSSLAPLLTSAYARITLIDLRYLDSRMLESLVDFGESPDVLFLYSAQVLNHSDILLVSAG